ncbi:MAG: alpha-galactosidase, partial [Oscillospiraceae bacterium]|nr:alpha-galactosidase [Oscillospiraceae bacterium]
ENGIYMQFAVNDEGRLSLYNFSTSKAELGEDFDDPREAYSVCEVQLAGKNRGLTKHIRHLCPTTPRYVSHEDTRNQNGRLLSFVLETESVRICQYYQFYDNIQVVSAYSEVENISTENIELEYVSSFCLAGIGDRGEIPAEQKLTLYKAHNTWAEELNFRGEKLLELGANMKSLHASSWRAFATNTGSWSTKEYLPMGILCDSENGETLLWQIENNGSWHWEVGDVCRKYCLRISGPTEQENGWVKALAPNEKFTSVTAAVVLVKGSVSKAAGEITSYRRKIIDAGRLDNSLAVVFNDFQECLWAKPTAENELPLIEKAAELGAEVYCMDAGWYAVKEWGDSLGWWKPNDERFDGSIKKVFDKIREKGMKVGLWVEPEVMGIGCPLVSEFDDCFFKRRGKTVAARGRYQLDFRNQKVLDYLNGVIDSLVYDYGVEYFKFDYNADAGAGTEVDADSVGDGLLKYGEAYLKWIDSLYERYPGLMIENCGSGGMRMDYKTLRHFALQSVSDAIYYEDYAHMSAVAPLAVIPEQAGIWAVTMPRYKREETAFAAVNAMLNRLYISGHIDNIDDENFNTMKEAVKVYKEIRADLVDCTPVLPCGICNRESDWMFAARLSKDGKTLYLSAAHMYGDKDIETVCLEDIDVQNATAEIIYPQSVGQISLCQNSLAVTLPKNASILVKINLN